MATILIVDDEPDMQTMIGFRLERDAHTILFAPDGQTALTVAKRQQPDLILLDVMMPGLDGFEVLRRLKDNTETENLPVILLTAKTDYSSVVRGWNMDAENYITKPFDIEELARSVGDVLRYQKHRTKVGEPSLAPSSTVAL